MKKALLTFGFTAFTFISSFAQEAGINNAEKPASLAEITFEKEVHDYGTIKQGANGICEFKFKNTGKEPLIITNARGSCGCTVPEWPKEPIKPGETGIIKVSYDTKRVGPINKSVTISSNARNFPEKVLRITGNVEAVQEDVFPGKTTEGAVPRAN